LRGYAREPRGECPLKKRRADRSSDRRAMPFVPFVCFVVASLGI